MAFFIVEQKGNLPQQQSINRALLNFDDIFITGCNIIGCWCYFYVVALTNYVTIFEGDISCISAKDTIAVLQRKWATYIKFRIEKLALHQAHLIQCQRYNVCEKWIHLENVY